MNLKKILTHIVTKRIFVGLGIFILVYVVYTYVQIEMNNASRETTCLTKLKQVLENGTPAEDIFQRDFDTLQYLVEHSLIARARMLEVASRLSNNQEAPLSSRELLVLKEGTEEYLRLRQSLYAVANRFECGLDVDENTLAEFNIDLRLRMKAVMVSLAAALTLYDNYMIGVVLFEQNDRLRKIINDPDMGFGLVADKLVEMTLASSSVENRQRANRAITFYESEKEKLSELKEDSDLAYLICLIDSSPSYNYVRKINLKEIIVKKVSAFGRLGKDEIKEVTAGGFDFMSGLFGNTVGLYEARHGKLYGDVEAKRKIQSMLQPLDILLEKTPFRLTDKLIPGHFGHVAIWTGTKAELVSLGVWNNEHIKLYADELVDGASANPKDGHQIIEALRSGVKLSTLDHFINIDDFAILRPIFDEKDREQLTKEAIVMAFRQLGKKYDFNFDVNTTDKIVCSELAYISFPSIDWPTQKTLGRYNISPDNVAQLAWNNVPLQLILLYHDGQLVDEAVQIEKMKELMTK